MKRSLFAVALLGLFVAAGCDDDTSMNANHDLAMTKDAGGDMAVTPVLGACKSNTDCKAGTKPSCVKAKGQQMGFCTASCTTDADCGAGTCITFSDGGFCAPTCQAASDCTNGDACWITLPGSAPVCFPPTGLDCDPTVNGCTTTVGSLPGGCSRQALGTGNVGTCYQSCNIGVGTCPPDATVTPAQPQSCYVVDTTADVDTKGTLLGDKLKGPICQFIDPMLNIADGSECKDPASGSHFFDICKPGSECDVFPHFGDMGAPDNLCHKLCYFGNFTPPDAGFLGDGGVVAMGCTTGTCTDVFGLMGTSNPIGLCK